MIMAASTMAPTAMTIPPSDMMFAVRCIAAKGMKDKRIAVGSTMIATSALRKMPEKEDANQTDDDAFFDQF